MMKLEVTKQKVLEAASKCSQAKATLKTLFPEAFEDDKYFDVGKLGNQGTLVFAQHESESAGFPGWSFFQIRREGEFDGKCFYLTGYCNWEIRKDNKGILCLIPTKKQ